MKNRIVLVGLTLCIALSFVLSSTACGVEEVENLVINENKEYPVTFAHSNFQQAPGSMVVLNDSVADILIACGYTDKIVGISSECNQSELAGIDKMGDSSAPDLEAIIKAEPDLVFTDERITAEDYDAMMNKDILVYRMALRTSEEDLREFYGKISAIFEGNITGTEKGIARFEELQKQMNDIKTNLPESKTVTTACYIFDSDGNAATGKTFGNVILDYAGAINVAKDIDGARISIETLKAENPNFIFCGEGMKDIILKTAEYKSISAVKRNRVFEIPAEYMTRQGNTMITAVKQISDLLYNSPVVQAKSVAAEYNIEIFEGISYTLDEEDSYVMAIQKRLDDLGYMPIEPTGYFGESTAKAVEEFQVNNDTTRRDGVADEETLKLMFSTNATERETPART